jgi:hypothetical protein
VDNNRPGLNADEDTTFVTAVEDLPCGHDLLLLLALACLYPVLGGTAAAKPQQVLLVYRWGQQGGQQRFTSTARSSCGSVCLQYPCSLVLHCMQSLAT